MDKQEAVEILKIAYDCRKLSYWPHNCDKCPNIEKCYTSRQHKEAIEIAIAANEHSPKPEALTLEQLREMDGEPVYCKGVANAGLTDWGIVNAAKRKIYDGNGDFWDFDECGETFLAYTTEPETEAK